MRRFLKFGGALCLSALMTACASTKRPYNFIDAKARPHINSVDSVLITNQDEIRADIKVSTLSRYIQGHFAPILFDLAVNGVRSYQAHQIMKPIHEKLEGYDFVDGMQEEFAQALGTSGLGEMGELELLRDEEIGFRAAYVRESDADAVMFIDVRCAFTANFDALHMATLVMVFPNTDALAPYKEKPDTDDILELEDNIYRNQFIARIAVEADEGSSKAENGEAWANMSEERLQGLMQAAAHKLAQHIANDLNVDDDVTDDDLEADEAIVAELEVEAETALETVIEPSSSEPNEPILN